MRDRAEKILKIVCCALAGLVLLQLVRAVIRSRPLANVTVPAVPTLPGSNEIKASATNSPIARQSSATNRVTGKADSASNVVAQSDAARVTTSTNPASTSEQQSDSIAVKSTNPTASSNSPSIANQPASDTNRIVASVTPASSTNVIPEKTGSNSVLRGDAGKVETNSPTRSAANRQTRPDLAMAGMPGAGKKLPDLPLPAKARIDRITDSELLGPVVRPMPMALLGIAGEVAFLRGPNGQTGLVKEGDSLGEIKLLRIGINRVLVEENGQKKELTIFNGYGSESLLAKQGETRDETIPK